MASKITIQCPECSAKLSLSDSTKLGKKIKCPKCQEVFSVPPLDEDEIEEDDEPKSSSSRKRAAGGSKGSSKGSGKKSGKGGSSSEGSNAPLIIGGIVGVVVLVGAGLFFSGIFNQKPAPVAAAPVQAMPVATAPVAPQLTPVEKTLGLRWMPSDVDFIVHAKLADIWQAPLLKGPLNDPSIGMSLQMFQRAIGVLPAEVESISIGISGLTGLGIKAIANAPANAPNFGPAMVPPFSPDEVHYIVVLRAKKPLDIDAIAKGVPNATMQEKNGKKYFAVPAIPTMSAKNGGWSPDPNTLILASEAELFATMDKGETVIPRKELLTIDHTPQVIIAALVRDLKTEEIQLLESKQKGLPDQLAAVLGANKQLAIQLAGIGLSVKGGIDFQVFSSSGTAEGATQLKAQFEQYRTLAQSSFDAFKTTAPPLFTELGGMLLTNLKIEDQNQSVKVSTKIPDSEQAKLEQLPTIVMMMAMTGGFNGLGGPSAVGAANASVGETLMEKGPQAVIPMKHPGETAAVDAVKAEGLPDGLKLSARTAWSQYPVKLADGSTTYVIEILIDATGDGLETICGATALAPKTMTIEGGSLKKVKVSGDADLQKAFAPFDANDEAPFDHPPHTLRVKVAVDGPTATKIDALEGTFKYLTSDGSQELMIDEAPKKVKRPLVGAEFKAMEIRFRRGTTGTTPESYILSCGKDHFLGQAKGTPGDVVSYTDIDKDQVIQRLHSNHEGGKFPEDFQVKLKVYPNVKEHSVSFRFDHVPLPSAETKPK